jgi:Tol biopolymer transport system component
MFENIDRRKILLTVGVVIAIGVLAWLLFILFTKSEQALPNNNVNVNGPTGFPPTTNGNVNVSGPGGVNLPISNVNVNVNVNAGLTNQPGSPVAVGGATAATALTSGSTMFPASATGDSVRYYNAADGKFYEISPDGAKSLLTDALYPQVQTVTWAPSSNSAILEFPDGANVLYDFQSKKQYTLPKEMTEFSFSSDGQKIAGKYLGDSLSNNWITTVNPDGSGLTGIEAMGENADKVDVEWSPNNQVVALSRTGEPAGLFQQNVLLIGLNGENFPQLTVDGRGFESNWTPDGKKLLYSVYSDTTNYKPELWLVDAATDSVGSNKQSLGLATWSDKCNLSGEVAYCAVPKELPEGAGFTREMANNIPDYIYRVNLQTGSTTLVAEPIDETGTALTATNLTISQDGKILYFTDTSGKLRSVKLQ